MEFLKLVVLSNIEIAKTRIHHVICRIKRTLKYLPIIWKDEDWDFTFFLEVLKVKLEQMKEYEEKYSIAMGTEENVKNITELEETIDKYLYFDEYWDEKNDHLTIEEKLNVIRIYDEDKETGFFRIKEVYADTKEEITEKDRDKISKHLKKYYTEEEKTWKQIWSFISKHSREWGD